MLSPRIRRHERSLAEIWRTVLSMDFVGVDDDYNDLGGDSLQAAIIVSLIGQAFQVAVPMGLLVEAPNIAQLAQRIDALLPGGANDKLQG